MKYILQTETPCVECGHPKARKEFKLESEKTDIGITAYERYVVNDCKKCGKYNAKLS